MFARVSTYQGDPGRIDEGLDNLRENIVPRAQQMDGFKGIYFLHDRESGKALSITLWESEEAMHASEEAANRLREEAAEASGETIESVERYEVVVFETPSAGAVGGVTDSVGGAADSVRGVTDTLLGGQEKQR
jgi:heme-degrading monooxygenase HmoA